MTVILSDDVQYQLRALAPSNKVSSWYNPDERRAYSTVDIDEVPENFRSSLIQHSTSSGSSTLMYPQPQYIQKHTSSGKIVHLNRNPSFTGDSFKVWWDLKNFPDKYEEFSTADPIYNHPHEYSEYGEYVIAFSINVVSLNMNQMVAAQFEMHQGLLSVTTPYFSIPSTTLAFKQIPYFEGDVLSIRWQPGVVQTFTHESPLEDFQYTFPSYGEKAAIIMESDGGYVSADLDQMFPDESGLVFIKELKSRNANHTTINNMAFSRTIKKIDCSKLKRIATQWYDCYELTSIRLPELTSIAVTYAINCMPNLKEIYAPRLKSITNATSTFKGNTGIERVYFPELSSITGSYSTFSMNASLSSVYMPSVISCNNQCFEYCINLKETDFSSMLSTSSNLFRDCISLEEIKLPKIKYIAANTFNRCQNLKKIDFSGVKDQVPTLANVNAFSKLPDDYRIIVDKSMLEGFQNATNWKDSAVKSHITSI